MQIKNKMQTMKFCKKLLYGNKDAPTIIFGLVLSEDSNFLIFKTGKREYKISQSLVLSLEDTQVPFRNDNGGHQQE